MEITVIRSNDLSAIYINGQLMFEDNTITWRDVIQALWETGADVKIVDPPGLADEECVEEGYPQNIEDVIYE